MASETDPEGDSSDDLRQWEVSKRSTQGGITLCGEP